MDYSTFMQLNLHVHTFLAYMYMYFSTIHVCTCMYVVLMFQDVLADAEAESSNVMCSMVLPYPSARVS
jgi:hypothetical protein